MNLDPILLIIITVLVYGAIVFFAFFGLFAVYVFVRYGRTLTYTVGGSILYIMFFIGMSLSLITQLQKLV